MSKETKEQGPLYIHYVQVEHALAAIKKYEEKRASEICKKAHLKLESIIPERERIMQSMKNMQLKEDETVSLDRLQTFLAHEQKLYDLHAKSLESTVKEITNELEEMVKDSLQFYKVKFWDPKVGSVEAGQKTWFTKWKLRIMAMYAALTVIPVSLYYLINMFL